MLKYTYVVLSLLDLLITTYVIFIHGPQHLIGPHMLELNPIARNIILTSGITGLFLYKITIVAICVTLVELIEKLDHKRHPLMSKYVKPKYILVFGIVLTTVAIIFGLFCF